MKDVSPYDYERIRFILRFAQNHLGNSIMEAVKFERKRGEFIEMMNTLEELNKYHRFTPPSEEEK